MRRLKNIIENFGILTIANLLTIAFGFFSSPLIIRNVSIKEYGLYTTVLSIFALSEIFNSVLSINVIGPRIIHHKEEGNLELAKSYYSSYFKYSFTVVAFFSIVIFILSTYVFEVSNLSLVLIMILSSIISNLNVMSANFSLIDKNYLRVAQIQVSRSSIKFVILISFILLNLFSNAIHIAVVILFSEIFSFILFGNRFFYDYMEKYKHIKKSEYFSFKENLLKNIYNFISILVLDLYSILSTAVIRKYIGLEFVAVYGVINSIVRLVSTFAKSFESILLTNMVTWIKEEEGYNVKKITLYSTGFVIIGIIVFNIFSKDLLKLYAGDDYLAYLSYFQLASILVITIPLQMSQRALIYTYGRTEILLQSVIIGTLVKLLLILIFYLLYTKFDLSIIIVSTLVGDFVYFIYRKLKLKEVMKIYEKSTKSSF